MGDFIHKNHSTCGQAVQKKIVCRATLTRTDGSDFVEKKAGVFCFPEIVRLVLSWSNLVLQCPIGHGRGVSRWLISARSSEQIRELEKSSREFLHNGC